MGISNQVMIHPKISIITVCYNAVDTIEKTILSVIKQTYDNVEYIIVDGGSSDGTIDIIKKYEYQIVKWISGPDNGIYDAMNKGIKASTGEWLNFMNAGDVFYDNDVVRKVAENVRNDADVIFGDVACVIDNILYRQKASPFYEHLPLHHSMGFNHQSTFVRGKLAKELEFDLSFKLAADYNMIITIFRRGGVFQQLNDTIIAIFDTNGISANKYRLHLYEKLLVDTPSRFICLLKSYLFVLKNILKTPIKLIIQLLYPNFFIKRRTIYFEEINNR